MWVFQKTTENVGLEEETLYNKGVMTVSGQPADPAGPVSPADPDARPGRISGK